MTGWKESPSDSSPTSGGRMLSIETCLVGVCGMQGMQLEPVSSNDRATIDVASTKRASWSKS